MKVILLSIVVVGMIGLMVPNAFAEIFYDEKRGFSINYPLSWGYIDHKPNETTSKILDLYKLDSNIFPKADIPDLRSDEIHDISDVIFGVITFEKSKSPFSVFDDEYLQNMYDTRFTDCKFIKIEYEEEYTCSHFDLIDSITNKGTAAITYSWIEKHGDKTIDNISIIHHYRDLDELWIIQAKIRTEHYDDLKDDINKIINSLEIINVSEKLEPKIPVWIKNNAKWWSTGEIDDKSFINGIQFLIDNFILEIPVSSEEYVSTFVKFFKVDKYNYQLPTSSFTTTDIRISGSLDEYSDGYRAALEIKRPDGEIEKFRPLVAHGEFNHIYKIKSNSPTGQYEINGEYDYHKIKLGTIFFHVKENIEERKPVPTWVRNTAGWWADGQISENEFMSAIQFLVKESIIVLDQDVEKEVTVTTPKESSVILNSSGDDWTIVDTGNVFSVVLVKATQNDSCSLEEKRSTEEYAEMSEYLLTKNLRGAKTIISSFCMNLDQIRESTYPLVLKEIGSNQPDMMIFVGNLDVNFESYYDEGAYGWWHCVPIFGEKKDGSWTGAYKGCGINIIVVCDCDQRYTNLREGGMWTLSHEIAHYNLFEQRYNQDVFADNVHWVEYKYRECIENNNLETKYCKKLFETKKLSNNHEYNIMDIDYLKGSWREIQNEVSHEILVMQGYKDE